MKIKLIAALLAGTMVSGTARPVTMFDSLTAWQTAAGTYANDTSYGSANDDISALTLDDGTALSFSSAASVREIPGGWSTWSGGYTGQVLAPDVTDFVITFDTAVGGFGLFAEPDPFETHDFTLTLSDGSIVSGSFAGESGAGFLGFVGSGIVSATLSSDVNFAVGDFYVTSAAAGAVPEPAMWAMMIGGFALAGAALRRRSTTTVRFA